MRDPKRPDYAVFRRRRQYALIILILLVTLVLGGLGAYLLSGTSEETSEAPPEEQVETPAEETPEEDNAAEEKEAAEERAADEEAAREAEAERAATTVPNDPTLYLTVPRLGLYNHTVRNDRSEAALDLGAIKLPETGFPWEEKNTNTYIACHRLGWPGTESYNQCLNLPLMQRGDEITLGDTMGRVYTYRVSEARQVTPLDTWVTDPVAGKDVVSLQTCIETLGDLWTMGPNWTARYVVQAERVS